MCVCVEEDEEGFCDNIVVMLQAVNCNGMVF